MCVREINLVTVKSKRYDSTDLIVTF
jgi:hypothetical protein